jgi:hypothetical protein
MNVHEIPILAIKMLIAVIHTGATVVSVKLDMKGMDFSTAQVRDY